MYRVASSRTLILAALTGIVLIHPAADAARADIGYMAVVTIYNKTGIDLKYQLRAHRDGEWTDWSSKHHEHPHGGWYWHNFYDADKVQIRFDRIGGDDEYTEKIYTLEFNRADPSWNLGRHHGRPYQFQFDAGGRLLDLYKYGW